MSAVLARRARTTTDLTGIFGRDVLSGARVASPLSFGDGHGVGQSVDNDARDTVSNAETRQ
jgi:hypothetical protein